MPFNKKIKGNVQLRKKKVFTYGYEGKEEKSTLNANQSEGKSITSTALKELVMSLLMHLEPPDE